MKLKYKLSAAFIPLILFAVVLLSFFSYIYISRDSKKSIDNMLESNANEALSYMDQWISINTNAVLDTKDFLERTNNTLSPSSADLSLREKYPDISDMYIGFKDKRFISSIGWVPPKNYDPTSRPWYVQAKLAGRLNYSDPYLDMTTKKFAISVGVPLYGKGEEFQGILGADLLLDRIVDKIEGLNLNGLGYGFLIDRNGVALSHPNPSYQYKNLKDNPETADIVKTILAKKAGRIEYTLKGENKIMLFRQFPSTGWILGIVILQDVAYKPISDLRLRLILFSVGTFILSVFCVWFFSSSLTKRLRILMEESKKITEGKLNAQIPINGRDEVSELAHAFNETVKSLQLSIGELSKSEEKYRDLVENSTDFIYSIDLEGRFTAINARLLELLNLSPEQVIGKTIDELHLSNEGDKLLWGSLHKKAIEGRRVISEQYEDIFLFGEQRSIDISFCPLFNDESKREMVGITATIRDISEVKRYEKNIHRLAYYDQLTSLPNRIHLSETINQLGLLCDNFNTKFALLLMNINDLKRINDSYGHAVGDELLKYFANILKVNMNPNSIIARIGGDEFIVILPHVISKFELETEVNNIFHLLIVPANINGMEIQVKLNMGITIYPDYSNHTSEIIEDADAAMYYAKKKGKNSFQYYNEEMKSMLKSRLQLEQELRQALVQGEFRLHFQPIFHTDSGKIRGFEALVRWYRENGQIVPPNDFIPLAEETGLICELGNWILREACAKASLWQRLYNPALTMSINISPIQLKMSSFLGEVQEVLNATEPTKGTIEFEITEGVFLDSMDTAKKALQSLKGLGIALSMDDFGTGYSSLSYLKNLDFDVIKIDKAFISDLHAENAEESITGPIISLSHHLKAKAIAEGVETEDQLLYLRESHCDFVQGFLLAKPLPEEEVLRRFRNGEF